MQGQVIYVNGRYRLIPVVIAYVVRDAEGKELYRSKRIDDAIDACDHMAELDCHNGDSNKFSPLPHGG